MLTESKTRRGILRVPDRVLPEDMIFRPSYTPGLVVSTIERKGIIRPSYINKRKKHISIDNCPIMLLPRAQVRNNLDVQSLRRMFITIPENGHEDTQLSTIAVTGWERTPKSNLRSRGSRSDTDSGIGGSLRRCVTFDNLSQSSSCVSSCPSHISDRETKEEQRNDVSDEVDDKEDEYRHSEQLPEHLDSFGGKEVIKTGNRKQTARAPTPEKKHHPHDCSTCSQCQEDERRMKKMFGSVDYFLDWIIHKWNKRKELQVLTKSNFVLRGIKPHFCNFVHGVSLHARDVGEKGRRGGGGDEEADGAKVDTGQTDTDSLLNWREINGFRSGVEGRPGSPSSVGELEGTDPQNNLFTHAWVAGQRGEDGISLGDNARSTEDKENDLQKFVTIPPPAPVQKPRPPTASQVNKGRSSSPKKAAKPRGGRAAVGAGGENVSGAGAGERKRSCVKKKTRKVGGDRGGRNSSQDVEAEVEQVTTIVEEKKTPEPNKSEGGVAVGLSVPDLPTPSQREKEERGARARRNLIDPEYLQAELKGGSGGDMHEEAWPDYELDSMSDTSLSKFSGGSLSDFSDDGWLEDDYRNPIRMSNWLTGRLALSQQSSRFTLPMDMKILEKMSPQDYLRKYCVISSRRHILYQKIFSKHRDKTGSIPIKDLEKSVKEVLVNTITKEEVEDISQLLEVSEETRLDYPLFCGIAAFAERILYPKFVTDDTADLADFKREKIECADFCALDWKFHGVNVNPPVKKLLKSLG